MWRKSKDSKEIREYYIGKAYEALKYCRNIIPEGHSSTLPSIKDKSKVKLLFSHVEKMRRSNLSVEKSVSHMLMYPKVVLKSSTNILPADWRAIKRKSKATRDFNIGNCDELSLLALNYLCKNDLVKHAEKISIASEYGDHVFVVIHRDLKSDINDRKKWGECCVIVDPLNNQIFFPDEINTKLKCYRFKMSSRNPHKLSSFTDKTKLVIDMRMESEVKQFQNLSLIENYERKINAIKEVGKEFLKEGYINGLCNLGDEIITQFSELKQASSEISNFSLLFKLSKDMKRILNYISEHVTQENKTSKELQEKLYIRFLIKSQIISGPQNLFESALHYEDTFLMLVDEIQKNSGSDEDSRALNFWFSNNFNELCQAAAMNSVYGSKVVSCLIDLGANPNTQRVEDNEKTMLHYAVENNNIGLAKLLLERGANPKIKDNDGITPAELAKKLGNFTIKKILNEYSHKDREVRNKHQKCLI